jgi:hypothetical protein
VLLLAKTLLPQTPRFLRTAWRQIGCLEFRVVAPVLTAAVVGHPLSLILQVLHRLIKSHSHVFLMKTDVNQLVQALDLSRLLVYLSREVTSQTRPHGWYRYQRVREKKASAGIVRTGESIVSGFTMVS